MSALAFTVYRQSEEEAPRPFDPAVHGTAPSDFLQLDHIEIAAAASGEKHVLMLCGDHTNYCLVFAFLDTLAENAAWAIMDRSATFGVPHSLMTDHLAHIKNEALRRVSEGLRVSHNLKLPYSPWGSCAVEHLGKELLQVFRAVCSEFRLRSEEWLGLLPLVYSALNNSPSSRRARIHTMHIFTRTYASMPISVLYISSKTFLLTVTDLTRELASNVVAPCEVAANLHPVLQDVFSGQSAMHVRQDLKGNVARFCRG